MAPTPTPETPRTQSEPAELETRDVLLNIGPAHPAMHGIVRIVTKLDGEQIQEAEVEIGYLHRGFEKMAETVDYNGVIPYTDRLNYVSPLINNMGYCMAVEKLLGISVPERCDYVRVIASEISRITDHLTCVGATAMELGAFTVFLYMIKAREYLWDLVEKVTGARLTVSYCRVGGVKADLPEDFAEPCRKAFEETRKVLDEAQGLLTRNRIFVDRMSRTGVISAEDAISYGITGPFLRATGADYDVRKDCPYAVYDRLPFDVPVGSCGDNMDRYLVRMEEMEQSMRIVEKALGDMPPGAVQVDPETGRLIPAAEMVDLAKVGNIAAISGGCAVTGPTLEGSGRAQYPGIAADEKTGLPPPQGRYLWQHRRTHEPLQAGHARPRRAAAQGRGLLSGGRGKRGVGVLRGERRSREPLPGAGPTALLCHHVGSAEAPHRGDDRRHGPNLRVGQHDRWGTRPLKHWKSAPSGSSRRFEREAISSEQPATRIISLSLGKNQIV